MYTMNSEELSQLYKDFWNWRIKDSPEYATNIGIHDHDDELDSYTLKHFREQKDSVLHYLNRAQRFQREMVILSPNDKFNLELFIYELKTYIQGIDFEGYLCPINYMEGAHLEFGRLISFMVFENVEDYRKLLARLKKLPNQINELIILLQMGLDKGMINHAVSMTGVIQQLKALQVPTENSTYYQPFQHFPENISIELCTELSNEGKHIIENEVLPGFKTLEQFLEKEYLKALRPSISCATLPNGAKFYQQCLNFHLSLNLTPNEVHEIGLKEVNRIEKEMTKIKNALQFKGTLKEFIESVKNDEKNYCHSKEELMEKFRDISYKNIHPLISKVIKHPPKMKMLIEENPSNSPNAPAAFYLCGSHDGARPGYFYVNTAMFSSQPIHEMTTLSLHEGEPGHHTQGSYLIEQSDVPCFRRFIEDRKYSDAPSRFPFHTSCLEGWALYSEKLGEELGLYDDLLLKFGYHSEEMFRACRLVVDTGMHALGWSREDAIEYMKEHSAAKEKKIENEIDRYITWPGQACAYKIGELKLKELRTLAEHELGDKFNIRDFHEVLLKFGGPLSILEEQVKDFIAETKNLHKK